MVVVILLKSYQNSHFLHIEDKSNGKHKIKMTLAEEVSQYIKENKLDIVVLGKRNSRKFKLPSDNITAFVLKEFTGTIMIFANDNTFEPDKKLTLGLFNSPEGTSNLKFGEDLMNNIAKPIKSFRVIKNSNKLKEIKKEVIDHIDEYVFELNDNTAKNMSNYMLKNNVNLLLLNRTPKNTKTKSPQIKTDLKKMVHHSNVSLLLPGVQLPHYNNL